MPIVINEFPAEPECGGAQWTIEDPDTLARLVGAVLIGRAHHAARVLHGTQHSPANITLTQKEALRARLQPENDALKWHRDGLLFEIICWLAAMSTSGPQDLISDPHLLPTQQGADSIRVEFDQVARALTSVTIYEQKCTTTPRAHFRDAVIPAFLEWKAGKRDNQLAQITIGLLAGMNLSDEEQAALFDSLVQDRPLAFRAALTVNPRPYATPECVALFAGYQGVTPEFERRNGDTLPLEDTRRWFDDFAALVWAKVEAGNV